MSYRWLTASSQCPYWSESWLVLALLPDGIYLTRVRLVFSREKKTIYPLACISKLCVAIFHSLNRLRSKASNGRNWPSTLKFKSKHLFQAEMPIEPFFERSREIARQRKAERWLRLCDPSHGIWNATEIYRAATHWELISASVEILILQRELIYH